MPRLLDLFCCQGGASRGYADAGFEVVGVDIEPQPRYPFEFIQADAVEYVRAHGHEFDAIHASPPCQAHTRAQKIMKREHPDFIVPTRQALRDSGRFYVIENVPGAPLLDPFELCGAMFGLETYRHRWFESNVRGEILRHPKHSARTAKMGRPAAPDEFMHIVGNFSGVERARGIMAMPWANRDGLREAIPPAYTHWIGQWLMNALALWPVVRTHSSELEHDAQ